MLHTVVGELPQDTTFFTALESSILETSPILCHYRIYAYGIWGTLHTPKEIKTLILKVDRKTFKHGKDAAAVNV